MVRRARLQYGAWAELVLIQLVTPNASFVGHLAGILAGLLYVAARGAPPALPDIEPHGAAQPGPGQDPFSDPLFGGGRYRPDPPATSPEATPNYQHEKSSLLEFFPQFCMVRLFITPAECTNPQVGGGKYRHEPPANSPETTTPAECTKPQGS